MSDDIVKVLEDLLVQATTERSHYYVASVCREAIAEIESLRNLVVQLGDDLGKANTI